MPLLDLLDRGPHLKHQVPKALESKQNVTLSRCDHLEPGPRTRKHKELILSFKRTG